MARQVRKSKKVIYVFCEGESEQEYAEYIHTAFADVAAMHIPPPVSSGLFEDTKSKFDKEARFRDNAEPCVDKRDAAQKHRDKVKQCA